MVSVPAWIPRRCRSYTHYPQGPRHTTRRDHGGPRNNTRGPWWTKAIQLLEYQTDVRRCRFDTLGKFTPAHRAGAPTARGRWVSPTFRSPQAEVHPSVGGTWYCPRPVGGCQAVPTDKYNPLVLLLHVIFYSLIIECIMRLST